MRRHKMSRGSSKRKFRHSVGVHGMNRISSGSRYVMRGGIRL